MSRPLALDLALPFGAFAAVTAIAEAAGAPNLGTAMTFGQLGFGAAMTYVLARRGRSS